MRALSRQKAVLLLILTSILWSFGGIIIKSMSWNICAIAAFRSLIALAVLLPFVRRPRLPRNRYAVAAALCYTGLICSVVAATRLTTAANAILLEYTAPVYSMLFGCWLLKEPIARRDVLSMLALFVGMAVFLYDGLAGGHMAGNLIALFSGACYGLMGVFMRKDPSGNPAQNVVWGNLLAFLVMLPFIGQPELTRVNLTLIVVMGLFQIGVPYVLYSIAVKSVTSYEITLITVLEPIMNPVWVFLLSGEAPTALTLLGGAIVLGAVILHETLPGARAAS